MKKKKNTGIDDEINASKIKPYSTNSFTISDFDRIIKIFNKDKSTVKSFPIQK